MIMKRIIAYLVCFSFLISAAVVFAEIKSLIKEYTYQASELDSKTTCRAIALEQVKRELLEELGTYVESTTVVQNAQIDQDEIRTISAGVVQTKVLDESWDGKSFWLKAEVSADPDEVAASIEKVRNDQNLAQELAESQAEKEAALQEVDRLQAELEQSNADKEKLAQYNQAVNQLEASDSFEQGTAMTVAGDYEGATQAYDRVIYLRPEDPKAYFGRSIVFIYLGNYSRATDDLDRAMVIRPANTNAYFQRASAYKNIRESRLINEPYQRQHGGRPPRHFVPPPQNDPLKRYLDNKQTQHRLVKANPFQPRPVVKRDPGRFQPRRTFDRKFEKPVIGRPVKPDIYRKGDVPPPAHLERKPPVVSPGVYEQRGIRNREGSLGKDQGRPEMRRQFNVPPPSGPRIERKPPIVQPRVNRVKKKELKEEKKNLKQRQKDEDEDRSGRR
jgi:tetratricopeptide (TPR) repeat protein